MERREDSDIHVVKFSNDDQFLAVAIGDGSISVGRVTEQAFQVPLTRLI